MMCRINTTATAWLFFCGLLTLLLTACSDSSNPPIDTAEAVNNTELSLVYSSEFQGFSNTGQIVGEADLVVIGQAGYATTLEELSNSQSVGKLQTFEIQEILLGEAPASEIGLLTFGANIVNEIVVQLFEQGGKLVLPLGGFGGLPSDEPYLLLLSKSQLDIEAAPDHKFEITGTLSQGAFYITSSGETRRFALQDVLGPDGNIVMSTTFLNVAIEPFPALADYTDGINLSELRNLIAENQSLFLPAADAALNQFIEISYFDAGEVLEVTLINGAPNNDVFAIICGTEDLGPDGCFIESFQRVKLDRNGAAQVAINVNRDMFQTVCNGPCYIVISSVSERYAELRIE